MIRLFLRLTFLISLGVFAALIGARALWSSGSASRSIELVGGHLEALANELSSIPATERHRILAEREKQFGMEIVLEKSEEEGEGALSEYRQGKLFLYVRVPGTPAQISLGPLAERRAGSLPVLFLIAFVIAAIISAWLTWYARRRILDIDDVAKRMYRGDFDARVPRDEESPLDPIAVSLNGLGDRVGQLLEDERDLLRTVAHEVRTPISRMHFRVDRIKESVEKDNPKVATGLVSDLEQVDKLFEELLTYVGFDEFHQDRPELSTEAIDVERVVTELAKELVSVRPDIELAIECDEGAEVLANAKLFSRAVSNLIVNAMAYGEGRIRIHVRVFDDKCVVDVQDAGPGIPEKNRTKVIKPFVRFDDKKRKGTGLGLAIVTRIMHLHGGNLHIVDSPMGGASVQLVWKRREATASRRGLKGLFGR